MHGQEEGHSMHLYGTDSCTGEEHTKHPSAPVDAAQNICKMQNGCVQEYIFNFAYGDGRVSMDVQQKTKAGANKPAKYSADTHKVVCSIPFGSPQSLASQRCPD